MKSTDTGLKRIMKAFVYSYKGLKAAMKSEAALRQDIVVAAVGTIVAGALPLDIMPKAFMISSLIFILFAELVNTAVETIIDRISADFHELSGKAKDIGSLLVLISYINAMLIWGAVLWDNFIK